ncbi:hypothetical protein T11_4559 [Trichinella zimbabwensis]|uniref:Integrase catalytic domain-containing protein n=1 Tax=Trichinella zimbabwensis TaxID=268475 RepID=A0A0V1H0E0_9BILA|nr:hypothetical protein T11_4559 [Trichinella zimbabwensis]
MQRQEVNVILHGLINSFYNVFSWHEDYPTTPGLFLLIGLHDLVFCLKHVNQQVLDIYNIDPVEIHHTQSPLCGGYWERLIRSIKNALRKTIRGALLKYDELHTVLCEIEARINDRPLVFMGDDIAGEAALTPAHFLISRELSRLPSVSTGVYRRDDTPSGVHHLIRRWQYQQRLTAQLWKRWKQEYITTLATRGRWHKTCQEPRVGDIVLVHEPSTTWIKWPIRRIIEIHPSEDGVIRSATVKTRQGTVTRSARSLRLVEPSERSSSLNQRFHNIFGPPSRSRTSDLWIKFTIHRQRSKMRQPGKKKIIPFDTERRSLEHRIQRLQRLCDNESDLIAIRDAINAVDEGKEAQEELPDSKSAKALAGYDQLLDLVTQLQSKANDLLKNSSQQPDLSQNTATQHQGECVPLSAIVQILKLPTYSGDILEFKAFWGQFDGAVHRRKDFDNVTKFVHLKSCLSGEALQVANGLTVTAENYEELVKLLHDRFHRTTDILDAHINRLHELQPASSHSRKELLRLHDEINGQLLEIRALGRDIDTRDTKLISGFRMLLPRLANLLPPRTRTKWKEHSTKLTEEGLTSKAFLSFLSQQALLCRGDHRLPNCKRFLSQGLEERKKTARTLHLCFKCLQHGHRATECKMKGRGWTLHRLLTSTSPNQQTRRQADPDNEKQPTQKKSRLEEKTEASANVLLTSTHGPTRIRFQTIRAIAHGTDGKRMTVNCLFDSAAERTLVREDVAQTLGLAGPIETITVKGIHGIHCHSAASRRIQLRLSPLKSHPHEGVNQPIEALTLTKICDDIPSVPFRSKDWKHLEQLHLTEERDTNLPIHILIGLDFYGRFLGEKILRGGHDDPVAIETTLGWVVFGPVNPSPNPTSQINCVQIENEIEQTLKKFWELDSIGIKPQEENPTQDSVSAKFHSNLTHDGSRYTVGLLWKPGEIRLPNNRSLAEQRLQAIERSIMKDPAKQLAYSTVIEEYIRNGWVEEVTSQHEQSGKTWYLPHHAVYKTVNGELKCRIVFDGSAKYGGVSLNQCLETGPNLQTDLVGVLLRFRQYQIAVQADIEKMYLQVALQVEDRDACRFLWRNCVQDSPVRVYRLTRVCFGLACSPYLAMNVIKAHAERNPEECDAIIKRALSNMYVDDLVMSCDEESEVAALISRVPEFLRKGGFHLRKWASNRVDLLATLPRPEVCETGERELGKALGVYWLKDKDVITFRPPANSTTQSRTTKRQLLSLAAKVYDPLGYLAPFTVQAKIMFQSLWTLGLSWDSPLPPKISKQWRSWQEELKKLSQIKLSRPWLSHSVKQVRKVEVHIFGDASQAAYAACAYLRVESLDGESSVKLMIAKTRVTPVRHISLPRLELMAALLCARLKKYIEKEVTLPIQETFCWSDSMVVLAWIRGSSKRWKPFVANRVEEIQSVVSPRQWKYCPTKENPADIPSRGRSLDELLEADLWWQGPRWLSQARVNWPREPAELDDRDEAVMTEQKSIKVLTARVNEQGIERVLDPTRYSSYERLIRVTAYCLRFIRNIQLPVIERNVNINLSVTELWAAEVRWFRQVQTKEFATTANSAERLKKFQPFLDDKGLLRMGGRLQQATLPPESKHPILLPSHHPLVELLIRDHHIRQLHAGVNQTLVAIRSKFWILKGRNAVKKVIRSCPTCRRVDAQPYRLRMGNLPADRVTESPPFSHTGVDFAGPLFVRPDVQGRDVRVNKAYVCIFTCMTTRAVHLELLREQTTDSFLQGLRRFISRRGRPRVIQSDNFRSFKLADTFIQCLFRDNNWEKLQRKFNEERIRWKFITPRAPWCGGYWERLIRSIKNALRKTI